MEPTVLLHLSPSKVVNRAGFVDLRGKKGGGRESACQFGTVRFLQRKEAEDQKPETYLLLKSTSRVSPLLSLQNVEEVVGAGKGKEDKTRFGELDVDGERT